MSLVDPDHITEAKTRHGAHYQMKRGKFGLGMTMTMIYTGPKDYFCVRCDEKILNAYAKCEACGYQVERCKGCGQIIIVRKNPAGKDACMNCMREI